jgi:hypothetical protein
VGSFLGKSFNKKEQKKREIKSLQIALGPSSKPLFYKVLPPISKRTQIKSASCAAVSG